MTATHPKQIIFRRRFPCAMRSLGLFCRTSANFSPRGPTMVSYASGGGTSASAFAHVGNGRPKNLTCLTTRFGFRGGTSGAIVLLCSSIAPRRVEARWSRPRPRPFRGGVEECGAWWMRGSVSDCCCCSASSAIGDSGVVGGLEVLPEPELEFEPKFEVDGLWCTPETASFSMSWLLAMFLETCTK